MLFRSLNIRAIDQKLEKLDAKFESKLDSLDAKFESKLDKLDAKFAEFKDSLASAKIWALGMYITLAGSMLYTIAKSAKWF